MSVLIKYQNKCTKIISDIFNIEKFIKDLANSNNLFINIGANQMEYNYIRNRIIVNLVSFILFLILSFPYLLYSQQWTKPEIITINRNALNLVIALDSKERIHLIWTENTDDHPSPDSIYFWLKENNNWFQLSTFGTDTLKLIYMSDLAIVANQNDKLHLVWGMKRLTQNPLGFMDFIYYRKFFNTNWVSPKVLHDFGSTTGGNQLGICAISDIDILTYWTQAGGSPTVYFKQLHNDEWKSPVIAIPQFSEKFNGSSSDPSVTIGPGDSLHIAFIGSKYGNSLLSTNFKNSVYYAGKDITDSDWNIIKEIYLNPAAICANPEIIVTQDGFRHIFWYVDNNADLFLDDIYYSYSFNGKLWSTPINLTNYTTALNRFPHSLKIVADRLGKLHLIWHYAQFPFPYEHNHYYYVHGREQSWSEPITIFSENVNIIKGKFDLAIDNDDRLHFVWLEGMYEGDDVLMKIKHATAELITADIDEEATSPQFIENFSLSCFPNPFNAITNIKYIIPSKGLVSLSIYDLTGREIKKLVDNFQNSGYYQMDFSACKHTSGIYFIRLEFKKHVLTHKLLIIK